MNGEQLSSGTRSASDDSLGSLAQAARSKQLRTARIILIVVGGLTLAINGFLLARAPDMARGVIDHQVSKAYSRGLSVDEAEVAKARARLLAVLRTVHGGFTGLGALFVLFGIAIYTKPVPITIASLVLYIGAHAIVGFVAPASLVRGLLVKIIIVVSLFKSIQSAIAYERERSGSSTPDVPVSPPDAGRELSG